MNEKFLSRGKRIEHDFYGLGGEWVYGIPIQTHIGTFICFEENPHYCGQYGYMEIEELSKVIPETVGRCTGLTDKNGKVIFEGDILDASWTLVGLVVIRFGRYKDVFNTGARGEYGHMGFYAECPHDEWVRKDICYFNSKSEIIGNIHDNPEMLSRADMPVSNDVFQPVFQPTTPENFELMHG